MPIERKLVAIMFTDIAGYTEQMSKDEAVAISLLETKKKHQLWMTELNFLSLESLKQLLKRGRR